TERLFLLLRTRAETDGTPSQAARDDVLQTRKSPATNEQNITGVNLNVLLFRMFSPALGGYVANGPFKHLEQGLLDTLAAHVAGDADVLRRLGDLVDFVDVDNAALGRLDVEVGGVQQFEEQVFDVLADVTGLGERR